jgi:hypothetical protein
LWDTGPKTCKNTADRVRIGPTVRPRRIFEILSSFKNASSQAYSSTWRTLGSNNFFIYGAIDMRFSSFASSARALQDKCYSGRDRPRGRFWRKGERKYLTCYYSADY